jgi:hypothetical protein
MSRRESLVGGEVVAEDVAEQAEKKRKQDEQRAAARAKRKRGGSGHGKATTAKAGTQGSEKEAEERRVKTEKLPLFDKENLKYDGEQAERRTVFRWFLRAHGKTAAWASRAPAPKTSAMSGQITRQGSTCVHHRTASAR